MPRGRARLALCVSALLCLFTACYDDTFDSFRNTESNSPYISFKIIGDTASVASRSDDALNQCIKNIYTLASEEANDTLYLIESETEGIMLDSTTKAVASRGEKINDVDKLDALGLYGFKTPDEGEMPASDTELFFDHWKLVKKGDAVDGVSFPT